MSIDLLNLEPHQVSRDLKGYTVLIYGEAKAGKTTVSSQFPEALILGFEKGYSALPGVHAIPIHSWTDIFKILKQLRTQEVQEKFHTIIIDTADLAYEFCEKYICNINAVDKINELPYGQGYQDAGRLLDSFIQELARLNYGVVLISHADDKTVKDESGTEYSRIEPTLPRTPKKICTRFCDIIGYARIVKSFTEGGEEQEKTYLYLRGTVRFVAGSRFKHTPPFIEFNYKNLVNAIAEAVEKQSLEMNDSVKEERTNLYEHEEKDYEIVMSEFIEITGALMKQSEENQKNIEKTIEKYIGKNKKVSELSEKNADTVDMINQELKSFLVQH